VTLVIVFCLGEGLNEIGFIVEFTFVSGSLSTQAANVAATIITRICFMPAAYASAMAGQGRGGKGLANHFLFNRRVLVAVLIKGISITPQAKQSVCRLPRVSCIRLQFCLEYY